jgi:hypothetical protein
MEFERLSNNPINLFNIIHNCYFLDKINTKSKPMNRIKLTSTLVLIVFALTISSPYSFIQIVKPAEAAGTLTSIAIMPSNNIVNTRTTYEVMFKTATTGTIKTIHMTFPNDFDLSAATRIIEKSGIGSGSISLSCSISSCDLKYIVSSPVSVPAGTSIRLEIGRIINPDTAGSYKVGISTEAQVILDGPTQSPSFPIKDITGNDVSPNFMIQKILTDEPNGNNLGWNPDGSGTAFAIADSDIKAPLSNIHISVNLQSGVAGAGGCTVFNIETAGFSFNCSSPPPNHAELHYLIIKLPAQITASSAPVSSSESTPSSTHQSNSSNNLDSVRSHDQIASEFP